MVEKTEDAAALLLVMVMTMLYSGGCSGMMRCENI